MKKLDIPLPMPEMLEYCNKINEIIAWINKTEKEYKRKINNLKAENNFLKNRTAK